MTLRKRNIDPETSTQNRLKYLENFINQRLPGAIANTVKPIVSNLATTIQNTLAQNYYTITQSVANFAAKVHTHSASDITSGGTTGAGFTVGGTLAVNGAVNPTGGITAGGAISAGGTVSGPTGTFNTALNSSGAYSNNITTTRAAMWISSAGSIGIASSSERFKQDIVKADIDPLAVLKVEIDFYRYRAEVEKHAADPDYQVHLEVGMIAERLHEAGLWPFVVYERNEDGALLLDSDNNPTPFGIHYDLWALAVHVATQHLAGLVEGHEGRIAALEKAVGIHL